MNNSHQTETAAERLKKVYEQRDYDLLVLDLWAHTVKAIGKDAPERVRSFGFQPGFLNEEQATVNRVARNRHMEPPYSGAYYHNFVRLTNNEVIEIPLIRRPEPPASTKVTTKVRL